MSHRNYEGCYCTDIRTLEDGTIEKIHSPALRDGHPVARLPGRVFLADLGYIKKEKP